MVREVPAPADDALEEDLMVALPRSRRSMSDTDPDHEPAHRQRERIRLSLLRARPELDGVLEEGPSGALVIPLRAGRCIEIGRMRQAGDVRWVVVREVDGRTVMSPVRGPVEAARTALIALEGGAAVQEMPPGTAS